MKKVFIIHGFEGTPNGGWRPWLMGELEKIDIYACALAMPEPAEPVCDDWLAEIGRHVERDPEDEIYLVGHSLGAPAILRYLELADKTTNIKGVVLVSCPSEKNGNAKIDGFLEAPFMFKMIRTRAKRFAVIHGDDDPLVPLANGETIAKSLGCPLTVIPGGQHLNGSSGFWTLPECLQILLKMFTA